eukprot:IDg235t1
MISTRPDIAYAVGKLSQYCENPLKSKWTAVKRVLRYIKGSTGKGIMYGAVNPLKTIGYSDSDWAGCVETRKSTEGFVFLLSGGAVSWRSKKQTVVATSSCEAEYISVCSAAKIGNMAISTPFLPPRTNSISTYRNSRRQPRRHSFSAQLVDKCSK